MTKSPLTGGWCDSYSSGRISLELKKAGYDGLVIRGRSNHPCYLKIDDRGAEIRDADFIWGKDSLEAEEILKGIEGKWLRRGFHDRTRRGKIVQLRLHHTSDSYRQARQGRRGGRHGVQEAQGRCRQGDPRDPVP